MKKKGVPAPGSHDHPAGEDGRKLRRHGLVPAEQPAPCCNRCGDDRQEHDESKNIFHRHHSPSLQRQRLEEQLGLRAILRDDHPSADEHRRCRQRHLQEQTQPGVNRTRLSAHVMSGQHRHRADHENRGQKTERQPVLTEFLPNEHCGRAHDLARLRPGPTRLD